MADEIAERAVWINDSDEYGTTYATNLTALFARIPDAIVRKVAAREIDELAPEEKPIASTIDLGSPSRCLVAWVVREQLAEVMNHGLTADSREVLFAIGSGMSVVQNAAKQFGGREQDWSAVFYGVCNGEKLARIEVAWLDRIVAAGLARDSHRLMNDNLRVYYGQETPAL